MQRPNILLVTTDTQRWDTLACMAAGHAHSPALDRLAAEGVLYEQAHGSSPVCMPARCSLITGYHTPIHGCIENGMARREDVPLLPDALEEAGYHNIMVGKTHFGPIPKSFHVCHGLAGEKGADNEDFYARHIRAHGYSRSSAHPNPIPPELFMDAFLADTTIREIATWRSGISGPSRPFFAFCSMPSPHSPNDPPGEWAHLYDGLTLPPINFREGEMAGHPAHLKRLVGTEDPRAPLEEERSSYTDGPFEAVREAVGNTIYKADAALVAEYRRLYYGLAAYCDAQIGRLLDYLDASGLREETLVIVSSDHGLQLFDHGFNDKHNYFDSSWRVPFLMSMPGTLPQGSRSDYAVWNDITATIAGAAGASMPSVQGFDLFAALSRGGERFAPSPRRCAVATLYRSAALATRRWKLEYYFEDQEGRLYDRLEDPFEQTDLWGSADHEGLRRELLTALLAWRADIFDVDHTIRTTRGGGPVARRIMPYTRSLRGVDAEARLGERVEGVENRFS